ncbi:MAG: hypothetical protein H6831_09315 [Planctomycetes bacterium]|nr:hypothetical protein [Planctomycetota bacterium]
MDALALLCTLHADGPTTLRRLRDAGCGSLEDLGHVSADRLAELLGVSPAAGRRFLREASSLADRIGRQGLEPEDDAAPAASIAARPDHAVLSPAPPAPTRGLDRTDRKVLERVIDRWRAEEAREEEQQRSAEVEHRPWPRSEPRLSPSERPTLEPAGRALAPGALDGLDARICDRLAEAGCATLEDLAADSALELARRSKVPFTLVRRLQFLAARAVAAKRDLPAAPIPARAWPEDSGSPSYAAAAGAREPADDGPAGPFA